MSPVVAVPHQLALTTVRVGLSAVVAMAAQRLMMVEKCILCFHGSAHHPQPALSL